MANNEQITGRKGRTSYTFVKQGARRDKRRQDAEARQREYDALSVKDRINRVTARGGSVKELARLTKLAKATKPAKA